MSKEFVDAVSTGNNLEAEDAFKDAISAKVGDALEVKRKELSNTFVKGMGISTDTEEEDSAEVR